MNNMGQTSGPAPASETNINSIPTVKITAGQARLLSNLKNDEGRISINVFR